MRHGLSLKSLAKLFFGAILLLAVALGIFWVFERYEAGKQPLIYPKKDITIPEGYTVDQIDALMFEEGIIIEESSLSKLRTADYASDYKFLNNQDNFEGFLFPDTYEFFTGSSPDVVMRKLLDGFNNKVWKPYLSKYKGNWYNKIILASIIEREVRDIGDDMALVAGLYYNRMEIGMPLQADITICYVKGFCHLDGVSKEDLQIKSPYNTYLNKGLPPTPIGNPGIPAIKAVLNPIPSTYLFYISDPTTKKTVFASTIDEHNRNIVKYLR